MSDGEMYRGNLIDSNVDVTKKKATETERLEFEHFELGYTAPTDEQTRFNIIEQKIDSLTDAVKRQNSSIQALNSLLTRVSNHLLPKGNKLKIFPLLNMQQLENIDTVLEGYSEVEISQYIKRFISSKKIQKCFSGFFHSDLLLNINWDGRFEKKPIKDYKLFSTYIFECVKADNNTLDYNAYVEAMRDGFRLAKNRHYKKKHEEKKKKKSSSEDK